MVSAREPRKGIVGLRKARGLGIVTLFDVAAPVARRQVGIEAEERHAGLGTYCVIRTVKFVARGSRMMVNCRGGCVVVHLRASHLSPT